MGRGLVGHRSESHKTIMKWCLFCPHCLCTDLDVDVLEEQRILWAQQRDRMLEYQKWCSANKDYEGAKFFKEEARHSLKMYRSTCLLIPHFAKEYPGDCEYTDTYTWPEELWDHLDYIYGLASGARICVT